MTEIKRKALKWPPRSRAWLVLLLAGLLLPLAVLCIPVPERALSAGCIASVRLLDRHELLLREVLSSEQGTSCWIPLSKISPDLVAATLVAEDRRFWFQPGVDGFAIGRALLQNARNHRVVSGASTIAMQVVANAYPRERNLGNKVWDALSAIRLLTVASHRDVLEHYMNTVPYGNQTFGVEAAARFYFNCSASQLSLAQAAMLAAIPCAPTVYDPLTAMHLVRERQEFVLREMAREGHVSATRVEAALSEDLKLVDASRFLAPHFCDLAVSHLGSRTGDIHTTLDYGLQRDLEAMLRLHLKGLEKKGATNGAVVVLDNATGDVLAMVGSVDYRAGQVNAALARRQPGSTLKPFTYGLALERGWNASTIVPDIPARYETQTGSFKPENYDGTFHGPVSLRRALGCSYNVAAVKVLSQIGPDLLLSKLRDAGFSSLEKDGSYYGLGLTLGDGEVTLLELARAYRALARGGSYSSERIFLDSDVPPPREIFSDRVCAILTDILSDKNARLPAFGAHSVLNLPFPCAAKTGTSRDYTDNWTVGYTTRYTVAVWIGNFDARPLQQVAGATGAGRLFRVIMLHLHENDPPALFERPAGLVEMDVCRASGELPGPDCTNRVRELFIRSYVPTRTCSIHQKIGGRVVEVYPPIYHDWMHRSRSESTAAQGPGIVFPVDGDVYRIDPVLHRSSQMLHLEVIPPGGVSQVDWWVDGRHLQSVSSPFTGHWPLTAGRHQIAATAGDWRSHPVSVRVR